MNDVRRAPDVASVEAPTRHPGDVRGPSVWRSIREARTALDAMRGARESVALVPTMGALHAGHFSLVERARALADRVVVSIFVNPLQFGDPADLERYPRTFEDDVAALTELGAHSVFAPTLQEMYPRGPVETRVTAGAIGERYEGASRPGHFDGVLTVVSKLLHIISPDVAVFGQKDAQQCFLVRRMVEDLNIPVAIESVDTVREPDGLAMSSRNRFLTGPDRTTARALSAALRAVADAASRGADEARAEGLAAFGDDEDARLDYLDIVDPDTFLPVDSSFRGRALTLIAATVGPVRLIDNMHVTIG